MRFLGAGLFGLMAVASTVFAWRWYEYFGGLLLLVALPLWLLFVFFLVRALRP